MNSKIKNNKEKTTNSDVSERSLLPSRGACKQRHCSLLIPNFSLSASFLFVLCSLLFLICFASCDLFTGPKVDLFKVISDEVDWANAAKLTVKLNYPSTWGTSNPQQGTLTPAMDIRKGYEFSLEFTPDSAYTLGSWQVYRTADLDELGNWLENISLINLNSIEALGSDDVTLPEPNSSGGTFSFTILTDDPVTIIPWCDKRPRITRTEPRDVNLVNQPVSRLSDIKLYFNCALDAGTVRLANSATDVGIWITVEDSIETGKDWFYNPVYAVEDGFFTVTLSPKIDDAAPPASSLVTVMIQGITNVQGEKMDKYLFSYNTSADSGVSFKWWNAVYNDKSNSISVSWTTQEKEDKVEIYYRVNNGAIEQVATEIEKTTTNGNVINKVTVSDVSAPDVSGVRDGSQVSGIREYKIFIELYSGAVMESRASFKIWNIPGMEVSSTNPVVEIRTAEELAAMKDNLRGQYALANDVIVSGDWMPVGKFDTAKPELSFTGKFYGNGHTITLNGGFNGSGDLGLFGYAEGAIIRDLTLAYNYTGEINVTPSLSTSFEIYQAHINEGDPPNESFDTFDFTALRVGGLAGHLKNSDVCNIITSGGTIKVKSKYIGGSVDIPILPPEMPSPPDGGVLLGGIAGLVEGSTIENCRAALSTQYTPDPDRQQTLMGLVSAIAGIAVGGSIEKVTIDAKVDIDATNTFFGVIGGAVGFSQRNTLTDITFSAGTVLFSGDSIISVCAGIVGMSSMVTMERCSFLGDIKANTDAEVTIGGLVGKTETNSGYIKECWVQGNIVLVGNGSPTVGGFLGDLKSRNIFIIKDCFFNGGNISVTANDESTTNVYGLPHRQNIGGFCGAIGGIPNPSLKNCGAYSGTITVQANGIMDVGGFISNVYGEISNSFSRMDIVVKSNNVSFCRVGGFSGRLASNSENSENPVKINNCFATGTVSVTTRSINTPPEGSNPTGRPAAGGLVGVSGGNIENCYALGNVVLSDSGNESFASAGGLVGRIDSGSVSNCFSVGTVSTTSTNKPAYSGGIVGYNSNNTCEISNTAALGASITASGSGSSGIGKISGNTTGTYNNNYAIDTMSATGGTPGISGTSTPITTFLSAADWKTKLNFSPSEWDFSTPAVYRGYPLLKGLSGQQ